MPSCKYGATGKQRAQVLTPSSSSSSSSAANAEHLQLDIIAARSTAVGVSCSVARRGILSSAAVNATYSEVTARTRVCLHIDITAGADLGRQREKGMEKERERRRGRDLIPSKLSADLLAVIW